MLFIDSNILRVSGVTCPSSGAQETVYAAWCCIQLSLILSFCLSRTVSVQGLVGPGLMCVSCRQIQYVTNRKTESRIIEYDTRLHTQFPELLLMGK